MNGIRQSIYLAVIKTKVHRAEGHLEPQGGSRALCAIRKMSITAARDIAASELRTDARPAHQPRCTGFGLMSVSRKALQSTTL
jgi:hypothetical protein